MSVEVRIHDKMRGTEETWAHPGPVTATICNGQLALTTEAALLGRWELLGRGAGELLVEE